jgi:hypothetical protein
MFFGNFKVFCHGVFGSPAIDDNPGLIQQLHTGIIAGIFLHLSDAALRGPQLAWFTWDCLYRKRTIRMGCIFIFRQTHGQSQQASERSGDLSEGKVMWLA